MLQNIVAEKSLPFKSKNGSSFRTNFIFKKNDATAIIFRHPQKLAREKWQLHILGIIRHTNLF